MLSHGLWSRPSIGCVYVSKHRINLIAMLGIRIHGKIRKFLNMLFLFSRVNDAYHLQDIIEHVMHPIIVIWKDLWLTKITKYAFR